MRVLAIVHEDDAGPGVFGEAAAARVWEVVEWRIAAGQRCPEDPAGIDAVLSLGGAMHAHETDAHPWLLDEEVLLARLAANAVPVLGVCLGAQLLARATGGSSRLLPAPEIGWYDVTLTRAGHDDPLTAGLPAAFSALQWHSCDFTPPAGCAALATSELCTQACRVGPRAWSVQFHAEVTWQDFASWCDQHLDQDGPPQDPEALRVLTRERIGDWNAFGRALFARFLDLAVSPA